MAELIIPSSKCKFISSTAEIVSDGGEPRCEVTEQTGKEATTFHFKFFNIVGKDGKQAVFTYESDAVAEASKVNDELIKENERLEVQRYIEVQAVKDELGATIKEQDETIEALLADVTVKDELIANATKDKEDALAEKQAVIDELNENVASLSTTVDSLTATIEEMQATIDEMKANGVEPEPVEPEEPEPEEPGIEEPDFPGGSYDTLADGTETGRIATTAPEEAGTITVYKNGAEEGEVVESIAAAFAKIPQNSTDSWLISLMPGTYHETGLVYKGSAKITLEGARPVEYGTNTLIVGQGTDMSQMATRSLMAFELAPSVVLKNITLKNDYEVEGGSAQAETLGIGRTAFTGTIACFNCSFLSHQDTICTTGKAWFYKCYIEGDVDYLWMCDKNGVVALYEQCLIRSVGGRVKAAYIAAPRLALETKVGKGVVIWNSRLQVEDTITDFYLGRNPWDRTSGYFDDYYENVAYIGTTLETNGKLHEHVWSGTGGAHGTENQQYIGFKTDDYFPQSSMAESRGMRRLTDDMVFAEYGNRTKILNRLFNVEKGEFENDSADKIWDTTILSSDFDADHPGVLEVDQSSVMATWNFAGTLNGAEATQYQKNSGLIAGTVTGVPDAGIEMFCDATAGKCAARSANGDTQINAGTILRVAVTRGATISITKLAGTFAINGVEGDTYTHDGDTQLVDITVVSNGYITAISVAQLNLSELDDYHKKAGQA